MTYLRLTPALRSWRALQEDLDSSLWNRSVPSFRVASEGEDTVVSFDLPGVTPEDVSVTTEDRTVTVSGKRAPERGGDFSRALEFPVTLDLAKAEASLKHGVLTIRVPKREEAKPRSITVQSA